MSGDNKRNCFTFTWTLENISFCWQKEGERIHSPTIVINELQEARYYLELLPKGLSNNNWIGCYLNNTANDSDVRIDIELAFLAKDGSVLTSQTWKDQKHWAGTFHFKEIREVFYVNRSVYLPGDKLTVRCRIWKNEGEMIKNVQCFAHTRICIESNSFLWNIKHFSNFQSEEKNTYQIKSMLDNELLLTFCLLSKNTYTDEDAMTIQIVAENGKIKNFVYYVALLNGDGSAKKRIRKEFMFCENKKPKLFTLPFSKYELIANKNLCLPEDVLTLRCDCTFSTGRILEEIESVNYDCDRFQATDLDDDCLDERNMFSVSKHVLNENLKSLFDGSILSDIKLQTNAKTFFAHKSILSARSPVFKAMFENNMREKLNDCVNILDLDDDTVYRMLQYVYTAEIPDLQWESACNLYRAADKYEILTLRDECSAYLKSSLSPKNACEVLIVADMHQDEDLKVFTQDFIFDHDVVNSEEWEQFMKYHMKLSADTMYLQIQRKTKNEKINAIFPGFDTNSAKTSFASCERPKSANKFSTFNTDFKFHKSYTFNIGAAPSHPGPFKFSEACNSATRKIGKNIRKTSRELNTFVPTGTTVKFNPPTGTDTMILSGVETIKTRHQCVTCMKEYENKSLEKLRAEDYAANQKGKGAAGEMGFGASAQQTSIFGVPAGSKPAFSFGGATQSNPFGITGTTKFPDSKQSPVTPGFGNNYAEKPVTLPKYYSDSEKTINSFSGLNIRNNSMLSASTGFNSNVENNPLKPPIPHGISSGTTISTSSGFNNIKLEKTSLTSISFGGTSKKEIDKPFLRFENSSTKVPTKLSFSLANTCEKKPVEAFFSAEPSFSFGSSIEKPLESSFPFGSSSEKPPIESSFPFGSSGEKPLQSSFPFGSSGAKPPVESSFPFGSSGAKQPVESSFPFGSSGAKPPFESSFPFGSNSAKPPVEPSFPFGSSSEKTDVKSTLSFGSSSTNKPFTAPFGFGSNWSANTPVKTFFSLNSRSEDTPDEPSFSFDSKNEKSSVKPSASFGTDNEKKPIKQTFSFGDDGDNSSSPSPEVNSSDGQAPSLNPGVGSSAIVNPCLSIESTAAETQSTPHLLNISNAKTPSLSVELKSTHADEPTVSSEIDGTGVETTETAQISCNATETPSVAVPPNDPVSVNAPSPSSELVVPEEPTHIESLASLRTCCQMQVSNAFDNITPKAESTSVIDITNEKLSASSGMDGSIVMKSQINSVLDISCAVTAPETSGLDHTSRESNSASPAFNSNSAETESSEYDGSEIQSSEHDSDGSEIQSCEHDSDGSEIES